MMLHYIRTQLQNLVSSGTKKLQNVGSADKDFQTQYLTKQSKF